MEVTRALLNTHGISGSEVQTGLVQVLEGRFKVELCRYYKEGYCVRGPSCTFAHGEHELRKPKVWPMHWRVVYRRGTVPGRCGAYHAFPKTRFSEKSKSRAFTLVGSRNCHNMRSSEADTGAQVRKLKATETRSIPESDVLFASR